jgi:hypothetical protein
MPPIPYGQNDPHPLSQLTTELVWEGKYDEYGNQSRVSCILPPMVYNMVVTPPACGAVP